MIHKFSEIKYRLKLRSACSGILRLKLAGMLEKQAAGYGPVGKSKLDILAKKRDAIGFDEDARRRLLDLRNAESKYVTYQRLLGSLGAGAPQVDAAATALKDAMAACGYMDIDTPDKFKAAFDDLKKKEIEYEEADVKYNELAYKLEHGSRGGGGGGGGKVHVRIKSTGKDAYVDSDEVTDDMEYIGSGSGGSGSSGGLSDADMEALAGQGNAYLYTTSDNRHFLMVGGQPQLEISDPSVLARLQGFINKASDKVTVSHEEKLKKDGSKIRRYFSNGTYQDFDMSDPANPKPTSGISFAAPDAFGGGGRSAADRTGITPEGTASFDEYLKDNDWTYDRASGNWIDSAGHKLNKQQYRDNLLRYGSRNPAGSFAVKTDYDSDDFIDNAADLAKKRENYNADINKIYKARSDAADANSDTSWNVFTGGQHNLVNSLAKDTAWDDNGLLVDTGRYGNLRAFGPSGGGTDRHSFGSAASRPQYISEFKRTYRDLFSDIGLGAAGAVGGGYGGYNLGDYISKKFNLADDDWRTGALRLGGGLLGGLAGAGGGVLLSAWANNRFNKRKANKNIRRHNQRVTDLLKGEVAGDSKYKGEHISSSGKREGVVS